MEELGRLLRETREKLGLTHEEVERSTRIRARYLEALERGDLSSLPSQVQARGFLRNYADFLGLDPDAVLQKHAARSHGASAQTQQTVQSPTPEPPSGTVEVRRPRWITTDLLVAMGIILAVLVVLVWGGSRLVLAMQQDSSNGTQQVSGLNLLSTASPTASATSTEAPAEIGGLPGEAVSPASDATLPAELTGDDQGQTGVNLRLLIERRAYIEVVVDGEEAFRGRAAPGEILEYSGSQLISIVTGNGGGVRAVYNGQDQGRLGEIGEVVSRLWDLEGAITPTPTPSSTPTPTEEVTITPSSTGTALP
jgi:transcriptional regulator with XRE-family HTH domain